MNLAEKILNKEIQKRESDLVSDGIGLPKQIQISKEITELMTAVEKLTMPAVSVSVADVSPSLPILEQMISEENEKLGKPQSLYEREKAANNKYCLAIVKELLEKRIEGNPSNKLYFENKT